VINNPLHCFCVIDDDKIANGTFLVENTLKEPALTDAPHEEKARDLKPTEQNAGKKILKLFQRKSPIFPPKKVSLDFLFRYKISVL